MIDVIDKDDQKGLYKINKYWAILYTPKSWEIILFYTNTIALVQQVIHHFLKKVGLKMIDTPVFNTFRG
jgi:hypothetical protein